MLHLTKDNRQIPIASLEDNHLLNCIKFPFKAFNDIPNYNNQELSYLIGKTIEKKTMTPELFNKIIQSIYWYVIEGLRRTNTRKEVLEILGKFNFIFKSEERIEIPSNLLLSNKTLVENEIDEEEDYFNEFQPAW